MIQTLIYLRSNSSLCTDDFQILDKSTFYDCCFSRIELTWILVVDVFNVFFYTATFFLKYKLNYEKDIDRI